ncbi:YicC/YloC family endoribonuclease [Aestuariispira insulae]|uniref:Uncharacterized protein (TIGR00255 family) n=1 Tax=Aestuariispira insulae TaxID=1461337 RepID=A0A3D9HVT6_9PROT|nr:YicC/YloC family endoribonuclease [Aestuariispira insulae]RED53525.1 uncharacterized protein (TIGR00255 family) [Aestuariispira insulae]
MTIASMTGFARSEGHDDQYSWAWEVRSVNGKGLDMRLRMPPGWERLDPKVRHAIQSYFKRGSLNIGLTLRSSENQSSMRVNNELLDQLTTLCRKMGDTPKIDQLLAVRGVVEQSDDRDDAVSDEARVNAILSCLDHTLKALHAARLEEGAQTAQILNERLDEIEALVNEAEKLAVTQPEALKNRIKNQVALLLEASPALPEEKLAQEAALLAVKADVREELDRLKGHVQAARSHLGKGGAIGRKLEFLCQEFNREANTLCSKSADLELTRIGLALKSSIDQLREQIANIE